jgi:GNAT superfamily N-acetyltransferase
MVSGVSPIDVAAGHGFEAACSPASGLDQATNPVTDYRIRPSLAHPCFHPFAAWDGDEIVATANLFIHGEIGSLNTAATLPSHRNRGAQSALIAARAKEAANAGCRWLCAETGRPADGEINPSLNNLASAGLRPLYYRQNWTWTPAD